MADRPNILSPTLRERNRYIAYQVVSESPINYSDLTNTIWHSLLNFLGELGTAEANVWIVKNVYNEAKQMGLVKCKHIAVEQVRTALALIQRIGDVRVVVKVLGVSGTLKAARKKFFKEIDLTTFTQASEM